MNSEVGINVHKSTMFYLGAVAFASIWIVTGVDAAGFTWCVLMAFGMQREVIEEIRVPQMFIAFHGEDEDEQ